MFLSAGSPYSAVPGAPGTLRVTVIRGERGDDDYLVIWRGLTIGRIMLASGVPSGRPQWTWSCHLRDAIISPCRSVRACSFGVHYGFVM
jgi:hypothetical protein